MNKFPLCVIIYLTDFCPLQCKHCFLVQNLSLIHIYGFTYDEVEVEMNVNEQSKDIQMGVVKDDMGAGDQGMMFGYATNETKEFMPLPYVLARNLALRTDEVKEKNLISYLRPDGKMQVTVLYEDEKPVAVTDVVISLQHDEIDIDVLRKDVKEKIIDVVIPKEYITCLLYTSRCV